MVNLERPRGEAKLTRREKGGRRVIGEGAAKLEERERERDKERRLGDLDE